LLTPEEVFSAADDVLGRRSVKRGA
jgi:hypothetical protein